MQKHTKESEQQDLSFLKHIGLVITYKCQVSCPHCFISAGPQRMEQLSLDQAFDLIRQISSYRNGHIKILSLTGGEPFYEMSRLKSISDYAGEHGLIVGAVTNAFWAKTEETAYKTLNELRSIKMLAISTDTFHQESIPFEYTKNAITAAKNLDIAYNVHVCTDDEKDFEYKKIITELRRITEDRNIVSGVTFQFGRAAKNIDISKYRTMPEPPVEACSAANAPVIFPDGRVMACIGPVIDIKAEHPLLLGNVNTSTLEDILENAEINPVLHAIRVWGPRKLISIIKGSDLGRNLPDRYIKDNLCNTCNDILSKKEIISFLLDFAKDIEFQKFVAYARVYHLNETEMYERLIKS